MLQLDGDVRSLITQFITSADRFPYSLRELPFLLTIWILTLGIVVMLPRCVQS
jgi:hypothetical protein